LKKLLAILLLLTALNAEAATNTAGQGTVNTAGQGSDISWNVQPMTKLTATGGSGSWSNGRYTVAKGATVSFETDAAGSSWCWDFGTRPASAALGTWDNTNKLICYSKSATPSHTFSDYGFFEIQVAVSTGALTRRGVLLVDVPVGGTVIDPTADCGANNLVGDGTTDNAGKLATCVNAISGSVTVTFPTGTYKFTAQNTFSTGSGLTAVALQPTSGAAVVLTFDPSEDDSADIFILTGAPIDIRDMTFTRTFEAGESTDNVDQTNAISGNSVVAVAILNSTFNNFSNVADSFTGVFSKSNLNNWGARGLTVSGWTDDGDGTYSKTGIGLTVRAFEEDDIYVTKATSSTLSDGYWYYDGSTTTLHYKPTTGVPGDHTTVAIYAVSAIAGVVGNSFVANLYSAPHSQYNGHMIYNAGTGYRYAVGNYHDHTKALSGSIWEGTGANSYFYRNMMSGDKTKIDDSFTKVFVNTNSSGAIELRDSHLDGLWSGPLVGSATASHIISSNLFVNTPVASPTVYINAASGSSAVTNNNIFGVGSPAGGVWKIYAFDGAGCSGCSASDEPNLTGCACLSASGNVDDETASDVASPGAWEFTVPTLAVDSIVTKTVTVTASDAGSGLGSTARWPFVLAAQIQAEYADNWYSEIQDYAVETTWTNTPIKARVSDVDHNWTVPTAP
jgi:hypothetical protein